MELSDDEPLADEHNALLPPDAFHLPVSRPVTHKIYRDAVHRSRLVLPFSDAAGAGPSTVAVNGGEGGHGPGRRNGAALPSWWVPGVAGGR